MFESRLNRGRANGYATLDSNGLVPTSSLPPIQSTIDTGSFVTNNQTGSFATTGSNQFSGSQVITGSLTVTSTFVNNSNLQLSGSNLVIDSGSLYVSGGIYVSGSVIVSSTLVNNANLQLTGSDLIIDAGNLYVSGGINVTGSVNAQSFTGSLFGTASYALNGGGTAVDTGSFATTGSNTFIGNQVITGSLDVQQGLTGSLFGTASYALAATALPAGADTQIQFNNSGALDGNLGLSYDVFTSTLNQGIGNTVDPIYASYSHVEGNFTTAKSAGSHAEGAYTVALGDYSHAEGNGTATGTTKGYYITSVTAGVVLFDVSYANITSNFSVGNYIHISSTQAAINNTGIVLGRNYVAGVGTYVTSSLTSINVSGFTVVGLNVSTAPNAWTGDAILGGNNSNSQGEGTISTGASSHAEGFYTITTGYAAHAEGYYTKALGSNSHAEGYQTTALGDYSHAEGTFTVASGSSAHAEGNNTQAIGSYSHAEGSNTVAQGIYSHTAGRFTHASGSYQHVIGIANILTNEPYAFIIGNGVSTFNRKNLVFASGSQFQITGSLLTTGSITLTGNQIVTGSTRGNVTALSITSNTASMDLSVGNFFTLQLVGGADTYINPSNILPGQTSTLVISTVGSGTVSWPGSVKQPSGSLYVPTTTTGVDIVTLASVDSSTLYIVGTKNMI